MWVVYFVDALRVDNFFMGDSVAAHFTLEISLVESRLRPCNPFLVIIHSTHNFLLSSQAGMLYGKIRLENKDISAESNSFPNNAAADQW